MTNNKKAQILAAVMCASSVLGGYTVVSAHDYTLTTNDAIVIKDSESQTGLTVNHVGDYLQIQGKGNTTPIRIYDDGGFSVQNISIGNGSFRVEKTNVKHDLFKINLNSGEMTASGITVIDENGKNVFSVDQNGTVISKDDVKATATNGTVYSLKNIGAKTAGITRKDEVTTIEDNKLSASGIESVGDVTSTLDGKTYSLNTIGANTAGIRRSGELTTVEGVGFYNSRINASNGALIGGVDITAGLVDGVDVSQLRDATAGNVTDIADLKQKTAGIERDGETTTIEENTSINKDGIKVGNNVEINANGSMTARNGDAYFNFDKDNIGLSNGNNTLSVGNESITIDSTGTKMVLNHDGLDYADGAFYVRNDGTVTANGSMTADDFITKDGVKLSEINSNIETATGTIKGIKRDDPNADYGEGTTSIEGVASFNKDGMTVNTGNSFVNVGTDNIVLNNSGNGIVIDKDGTSIIGAQGKHSINITTTGTEFLNGQDGTTTVISGGTITTNTIKIGDNIIDDSFFGTIGQTNANTAGITRTEINGDWVTSIEGAIKISESGYISLNADNFGFTYSRNDGTIGVGSLGDLANRVDSLEQKTQGISYDEETGTTTIDGDLVVKDETTGGEGGATGEGGNITSDSVTTGNITADKGTIGDITMENGTISGDNANISNKVTVGGEGGTTIDKDGITVGTVGEGESHTSITKDDVKVTDSQGNTTSLTDVGNRVTGLESSMNSMNNRINDVEDRIDKVGAMAAAIANLRTMGFDPEAPTEIAIGVGQYKSETGLALGVFHYPNQDFMLSASISTSGDEVMGGIGATWKLGRKSAAEKAKDEEAKRLEKAEDMKKLAQEEKVKAQAERHAKLLAEREAQETA